MLNYLRNIFKKSIPSLPSPMNYGDDLVNGGMNIFKFFTS